MQTWMAVGLSSFPSGSEFSERNQSLALREGGHREWRLQSGAQTPPPLPSWQTPERYQALFSPEPGPIGAGPSNERHQPASTPLCGFPPISNANQLPSTNGETSGGPGMGACQDHRWDLCCSPLGHPGVSPEDSALQPSLTRALTLLPSSGYSIRSICRSLAESETSSTGRRLSPVVLTWKKGHFPQHKLDRGLRESLGGLEMQGGKAWKSFSQTLGLWLSSVRLTKKGPHPLCFSQSAS